MDTRTRLLEQMQTLCAELGPGDGLDPKLERERADRTGCHRKQRQLCGQVARALDLALGSVGSGPLQGASVVAVHAGRDSARLEVHITHADPTPALVAGLCVAQGWLRSEVAAAITRKRTPYLDFVVVAAEEHDHE